MTTAVTGFYFITINTEKNLPILSTVGRGLAPAEVYIEITSIGEITKEQLLALEERFACIKIHKYIIMPTHIHAIFIVQNPAAVNFAAGASPRPTALMDIIGAFKSLTTWLCNRQDGTVGRRIWQTFFYDHIIRDQAEYLRIWQYIDENPARWEEDEYYI